MDNSTTKLENFEFQKYEATKKQIRELKELIDGNVSETEIHNYLERNRELFAFALYAFQTGHHATYVISKQNIKPHIKTDNSKGMIPDFLVGGENSDGITWWVIELKGVSDKVFTSDGEHVYFNSVTNKGVFQLLEYIDFCNENQSMLREVFGLKDFREPNALILIGNEEEFSDVRKKKMKAAWNRLNPKKLEIRTYSWLLRNFIENDKHFDFKENEKSDSWLG